MTGNSACTVAAICIPGPSMTRSTFITYHAHLYVFQIKLIISWVTCKIFSLSCHFTMTTDSKNRGSYLFILKLKKRFVLNSEEPLRRSEKIHIQNNRVYRHQEGCSRLMDNCIIFGPYKNPGRSPSSDHQC